MHPILRLYEDELQSGAQTNLPPLPRMIFVVRGTLTVEGQAISEGEAWHGECRALIDPARAGVTYWRFELVPKNEPGGLLTGSAVMSRLKIAAALATLPKGDLLWRGDSVAFPPGGCAYLHRHQGPGIRCLVEGGIRIDTQGHSTHYAPGEAWYEAGPDPVFARAAEDQPTRFIRVLILPRDLLGKSSIQYVNEADRAKPRLQQYKVFVDAPIAFRDPEDSR
jgi:hypothetical protein